MSLQLFFDVLKVGSVWRYFGETPGVDGEGQLHQILTIEPSTKGRVVTTSTATLYNRQSIIMDHGWMGSVQDFAAEFVYVGAA